MVANVGRYYEDTIVYVESWKQENIAKQVRSISSLVLQVAEK